MQARDSWLMQMPGTYTAHTTDVPRGEADGVSQRQGLVQHDWKHSLQRLIYSFFSRNKSRKPFVSLNYRAPPFCALPAPAAAVSIRIAGPGHITLSLSACSRL